MSSGITVRFLALENGQEGWWMSREAAAEEANLDEPRGVVARGKKAGFWQKGGRETRKRSTAEKRHRVRVCPVGARRGPSTSGMAIMIPLTDHRRAIFDVDADASRTGEVRVRRKPVQQTDGR